MFLYYLFSSFIIVEDDLDRFLSLLTFNFSLFVFFCYYFYLSLFDPDPLVVYFFLGLVVFITLVSFAGFGSFSKKKSSFSWNGFFFSSSTLLEAPLPKLKKSSSSKLIADLVTLAFDYTLTLTCNI